MKIKLTWLYPDIMNTYGDRGNIICLQKRCEWRGINIELQKVSIGDEFPKDTDILFMGGAQDMEQTLVEKDLKSKGEIIRSLIEEGVPSLFVCAGFQFLGEYYEPQEGVRIEGLNILKLYSLHPEMEERCIGNAVIASPLLGGETIVGFENHGGRTILSKDMQALGLVIKGTGNNLEDETEGVVYKNTVGSYLHGPLLPKNPKLADFFIKTALEKKYGVVTLMELNDNLENLAHKKALTLK